MHSPARARRTATAPAAALALPLLALLLELALAGAAGGSPVLGAGHSVDAASAGRTTGMQDDADGNGTWTLSVVHLNDFHARFDPVSPEFTSCDPSLVNTCVPYPCRGEGCVGGVARVATAMARLRKRHPHSIVLNAGDNFQGSIFYLVHRHKIMSFFLNRLGFDAMALGNHEFDQGVGNVKSFLERLAFPALSANMKASADPELARLVKASVVLERDGRRVGVIGYTLNNTHDISKTGSARWGSELAAVDREAERLKASGVDIIVCVSHDGLAGDKYVAENSKHVDLIVGGHSHTLLYSGTPPSDDRVFGDYPVLRVQQPSGRQVLVVQAMAASKYLGHILVTFDRAGEVVHWKGQPLLLDQSVSQDARTLALLRPWRPLVNARGGRRVGLLDERLSQDDFECLTGECSIGNVVADAFVDHWRKRSSDPPMVGAVVGWSMVANLEKGPVTFEDVFNVLPYEYTVDSFRITGKGLLAVLEASAAGEGLFQWSGLRVTLDTSKPAGERVQGVWVRTRPEQPAEEYGALEHDREYHVAAQSVAMVGGYANTRLRQLHANRTAGPFDYNVLATYLSEHYNLARGRLEDRVTMLSGRAHPRRFSGLPNHVQATATATTTATAPQAKPH